eukprot:scaffold574823_cov45-Prasinocladus_malaysianus.AAC.1
MSPPPQGKDAERTGAERMLEAASELGVEIVFANPGTTEMWLVGALDSVPAIRPVLCLAETVVTGAADGYGRMARKPALTILHLARPLTMFCYEFFFAFPEYCNSTLESGKNS